ncbi:MAG: molecular chaperone DnaJ [Deltaproteobacteria bacterium]|nr:MAG: molecular chaperone DnaJ [Deltaproteobacteria bacterium]
MQYRQTPQPGCGGCLLIAAMLLLVTGGAPALLNFLGFLFFTGILGILLLIALFYGFTYHVQQRVSTYEASQTEAKKRYVYLLVHVLVKIAQIDGRFTKAELATMTNFFQYNLRYSQDQMYWVKQMIKEARSAEVSMEELLTEIRDGFGHEPRLILMELVYQIIYLKHPVVDAELQQARAIASFLKISVYEQRTIEAKYMYRHRQESAAAAQSDEHYYAVLGLDQGASFAQIKKSYRKLSMQYHPDKVAHLGDEFKGVAEEKMKEINAAYDYFKRKFGEQ